MTTRKFNRPQRQRGAGMLSVFVMLCIGLFLGLFALKMVPEYMENWTVEQIAEDAQANPEILKQTKAKIYDHLNRAYRQNNLWDLTAEDTIVLDKKDRGQGYSLKVKYEKRVPFIHNIHLVAAFESSDGEAAPAPAQ
ncbi:MAG: DUF4845 domain-containing protein [Granulosicoccus sp.]